MVLVLVLEIKYLSSTTCMSKTYLIEVNGYETQQILFLSFLVLTVDKIQLVLLLLSTEELANRNVLVT